MPDTRVVGVIDAVKRSAFRAAAASEGEGLAKGEETSWNEPVVHETVIAFSILGRTRSVSRKPALDARRPYTGSAASPDVEAIHAMVVTSWNPITVLLEGPRSRKIVMIERLK